jgi:hypothetical protein
MEQFVLCISVFYISVVIQSNENVPPLNDETILFVEGHKVLGQVNEMFNLSVNLSITINKYIHSAK